MSSLCGNLSRDLADLAGPDPREGQVRTSWASSAQKWRGPFLDTVEISGIIKNTSVLRVMDRRGVAMYGGIEGGRNTLRLRTGAACSSWRVSNAG